MRLLLVTNGLRYGGAERVVQALAQDVVARGHAVHVVATTRDGPIGEALRQERIPVSVLHIASQLDGRVPLKLFEVARRFRADLLHSHLAVADIATSVAAPMLQIPAITTVHNRGVELTRFKKLLWRVALGGFQRVLAVSEPVRASLPVGVDAQVLRPSLISGDPVRSRAAARRDLGVGETEQLILGVGRLTPIKGFDLLAEAVEGIDARTIIIGDGDDRGALAGTRLELIGARADAAELMSAADVVVCPSRSEGFPQVPLHAMAAGVPVVATAVGGTPEIVVDGETGFLVPPEDPRALARAIRVVLSDPARARALGEAGRRRLLATKLTREGMVEAHLTVYREVLDEWI